MQGLNAIRVMVVGHRPLATDGGLQPLQLIPQARAFFARNGDPTTIEMSSMSFFQPERDRLSETLGEADAAVRVCAPGPSSNLFTPLANTFPGRGGQYPDRHRHTDSPSSRSMQRWMN